MNSKLLPFNITYQRGSATLLVTVILLALITLVSVYITKLGLLEVKTGANANRAKEALHHAQAGLDYGALMYLDDNSFTAGSLAVGGTTVNVTGVTSGSLYTITATGESVDGTGSAEVKEGYGRIPLVDFGELPPLMSNGNFPPSGTFSIVANPNGGGTGVPVSAWVEEGTTGGGASWQNCNMDEFLCEGNNASQAKITHSDGFIQCDDCRCQQADNPICDAKDVADPSDCLDVVEDLTIPDVFQNTFGVSPADGGWEAYKAVAATEVACADLNTTIGDQFYAGGANDGQLPLLWVDGDCTIGDTGSYDAPVIVVVHGDLTINAGSKVFGIIFAFSDIYSPAPSTENYNLKINGSPVVYGVMLVNADVDLPNGSFTLVYSQNILEKLSNVSGNEFYTIGRRSGSWTDF
jgi:hypothetical protein